MNKIPVPLGEGGMRGSLFFLLLLPSLISFLPVCFPFSSCVLTASLCLFLHPFPFHLPLCPNNWVCPCQSFSFFLIVSPCLSDSLFTPFSLPVFLKAISTFLILFSVFTPSIFFCLLCLPFLSSLLSSLSPISISLSLTVCLSLCPLFPLHLTVCLLFIILPFLIWFSLLVHLSPSHHLTVCLCLFLPLWFFCCCSFCCVLF